ncbi:MAG: hypothetical protein Q4B42_04305, partial [Oscillospiraceae bacterium]|nr:hypothetical protein [Oscillospiraceae bacterium]
LLCFDQTSSIAEATGDLEETVMDYIVLLRTRASTDRDPNTAEPIIHEYQLETEARFSAIRSIYKILIWPALALALFALALDLRAAFRELKEKKPGIVSARAFMLLGLLLSVVLRVAIVSYVEAVSFMIGTYLLYLSSAGPLLLLFATLGTSAAIEHFETLRAAKKLCRVPTFGAWTR